MRILSGVQPSGKLHIGNYFGAMKPMLDLQEQGEPFYFIADYHSLTSVDDPDTLRANVRDVAMDFLACGLNPEKAVLFKQSDVPEVNELAWILSTVCPMGLLERCHSYKDKTARGFSPNHALFAYPVLMAADILLYDSDVVPVGKDQKQHLEVTRDLAMKINDKYGEDTLKLPEPRIQDSTAVVPGLDGQKMSKSYGNALPIFGAQKKLRKLVMKIPTDSTPVEDPKPTDGSIILQLYKLFATDSEYADMVAAFENGGCGYGDLKQQLFDAYWRYFEKARARREVLENNPMQIDQILSAGAEKAREAARVVLERVKLAVGLI